MCQIYIYINGFNCICVTVNGQFQRKLAISGRTSHVDYRTKTFSFCSIAPFRFMNYIGSQLLQFIYHLYGEDAQVYITPERNLRASAENIIHFDLEICMPAQKVRVLS